jgi:hypothetical protein
MFRTLLTYVRHAPLIVRKLQVAHQFSFLLDEATPEQLDKSLRAWRIFKREYGYLRSLVEEKCVDAKGNPIPWYTYPAIEQLSTWDFRHCDILEYGSGNSTLWWMDRARSVTSIEHSIEWHQYVSNQVNENCKLLLSAVDMEKDDKKQIEDYVGCVGQLGYFDVIIVDGVNKPGVRMECARRALEHLKPGGLFIIDNSDRLPDTCKMMRNAGFLEIDFKGLGPMNQYAETTSLFFMPDFQIKPRNSIHPGYAIGGLQRYSDKLVDTGGNRAHGRLKSPVPRAG